jgi:hypothetical protein
MISKVQRRCGEQLVKPSSLATEAKGRSQATLLMEKHSNCGQDRGFFAACDLAKKENASCVWLARLINPCDNIF